MRVRGGSGPVRQAPTHAARAAQRPGAAASIIIFAQPRENYALLGEYFATSFFVPRTPARWFRKRLWAGRSGGSSSGSPVPIGSGGRTANALILRGSVVLFCGPSRDARAGTAARVCVKEPQNHRTTEPLIRKEGNLPFPADEAVLRRFYGSRANKEWGGYCLRSIAGASRPLPGLDGGTGGAKFWAGARLAAGGGRAIGADLGQLGRVNGNGGFLQFFDAVSGRVGMASLERRRIVAADQRFAARRIQPAGLRAAAAGSRGLDLAEATGVDRAGQGGTPPSPAPSIPLPKAQPIFGVSAAFRIRCAHRAAMVRNGSSVSNLPTGSGDEGFRLASRVERKGAAAIEHQTRVGENGMFPGRGRSRATLLCTGAWGVN